MSTSNNRDPYELCRLTGCYHPDGLIQQIGQRCDSGDAEWARELIHIYKRFETDVNVRFWALHAALRKAIETECTAVVEMLISEGAALETWEALEKENELIAANRSASSSSSPQVHYDAQSKTYKVGSAVVFGESKRGNDRA